MSASIHSSSSKKSTSTKSHHHPATPEATTAPASEKTSASTAPISAPSLDPAPSAPSQTAASSAIAQLDALEASLNLDIVVRPNDKDQIRALNRVSDTALSLASDIVSSDPSRFTDFAAIPTAVKHVQTMTPLVARAVQLGVHLQKSVQNNRVPAAQQTLALYSVVKGLGRIVDNETMREKIPQLKAELAPKHKTPRVKKTKEQVALERAAKSQADRLQKAQVIVNNGGARPGTTPVVLSSPAAPSSPVTPATPPAPAAEPAPVAVPAVNGAAVATPASH